MGCLWLKNGELSKICFPTLDKNGIFVYNKRIYVNAVTELSALEDSERGRSVKALVRTAVADLSLCCENSDVTPALKASRGQVFCISGTLSIWVVTRSFQLRPMILGRGCFCFREVKALSVRLSKEDAEKRLYLRKETVRKVCLKKADMTDLISRVAVVLDVSGSMAEAFRSGMVQATLERLLPLAMAFDDDGSMEVWTFTQGFQRHPPLTRGNFYNYIRDNGLTYGGGTNYSPVIRDVCNYFISEEPASVPTYVIFITDGDNFDPGETDAVIRNASYFPIFFQFVGIGGKGGNGFSYLRKLDDMDGRYVDNANFFMIPDLSDINIIDDDSLYMKLLDEYPKWLRYPQVRDMIGMGERLHEVNKKQLKKINKVRTRDLDTLNGGNGGAKDILKTVLKIGEIILELLDAFLS